MSSTSMQPSNTSHPIAVPVSIPKEAARGRHAIDRVIATFGLRREDHVLVIGRNLSDRLAALAHYGCRSATGADPASLYMRRDRADVVWMTDGAEVDVLAASVLSRFAGVRSVIVELAASLSLGTQQSFLQRLREMGFDRQSSRLIADRRILTAHPAEWLQWVA